MVRGAWQATAYVIRKSQIWLSDFHFGSFLTKVNVILSYDLANTLTDIYPNELKR